MRRFAALATLLSWTVISGSVTKYMHYATVCLPPLAVVLALLWNELWEESKARGNYLGNGVPYVNEAVAGPTQRERRPTLLGILPLSVLLIAMAWSLIRYIQAEPAVFVHLTTYLYTGPWRSGAGETWGIQLLLALAALSLVVSALASQLSPRLRSRWGCLALLTLVAAAWVNHLVLFADYIPRSSASWSQRDAITTYYKRRGPDDEIASWWFYHRGETFYTKRKIWVLMRPDAAKLRSWIAEKREDKGDLWFTTAPKNLDRLRRHLPRDLRSKLELEYENSHQLLLRLRLNDAGRGR